MAWNEPGGGGNRDPWSGSGKNQGPPDLDEVLRKVQDRVRGMFGGKPPQDGDGGAAGGGGGGSAIGIGLLAVVLVVVWLLSGIYIVNEGTRGVVLRFGEYVGTSNPGIHWRIPYPVDEVRTVNIENVRTAEIGYEVVAGGRTRERLNEALMLTQDENIVNVQLAVHYQVSDPRAYLFNFRDPDATIKALAESAIREMVGKRQLDFVLTEGREEVAAAAHELVQRVLDEYEAGLTLNRVAVQDVQPPEEVQGSFADAIRAREDEQRFINEARAYRNEVLPRAAGEAARLLEEAEGYRARVVARAEGESSRFMALLTEYQAAPAVMRERLYLDAMEQVLQQSTKVFIDVPEGGPMMFMPLDRIMQGQAGRTVDLRQAPSATIPNQPQRTETPANRGGSNNLRARETR